MQKLRPQMNFYRDLIQIDEQLLRRVRRCSDLLNSPLPFEGVWDYTIIARSPTARHYNHVAELRKQDRHRNKQDKESTKRTILR
jgi:hypothetical protein